MAQQDPSLLKEFSNRFETESKQNFDLKKLTKHQKKRFKKKELVLRKKCFNEYLTAKQYGQEVQQATFDMTPIQAQLKQA